MDIKQKMEEALIRVSGWKSPDLLYKIDSIDESVLSHIINHSLAGAGSYKHNDAENHSTWTPEEKDTHHASIHNTLVNSGFVHAGVHKHSDDKAKFTGEKTHTYTQVTGNTRHSIHVETDKDDNVTHINHQTEVLKTYPGNHPVIATGSNE